MKFYIKKRLNFKLEKFLTFIFSMCLVLLFSIGLNVSAQKAKIVEKNYKPKTKPTPVKPTPTVKKYVPPQPKQTPKAKAKKSSSKKTSSKKSKSRSRNSIGIIITTPTPQQEVWLGNEMLGISDENAQLETSMKKGNYLISFKDKDGDESLGSQLVTINTDNKEFTLAVNIPEENENNDEPTAEQVLLEQRKVALDAADKIKDIFVRYGDPLKTNTVTLSDWEFVYQSAQANNLKNFTAIQIEAQRWFSSGQIDFAKGNYANAYGNFNKAIEFMPDSAYPYYALGDAYTANKLFAEGIASYQKAVQINPKFALAHRKIGDIYLKSNRVKEATASFEAALENGFDTPGIRFELGKSYLGIKEWDKASKELEYVVKEAPTEDVYLTLGSLYIELKRNISAYESYKKATEYAPNSARAFYKLGEVLLEEREYEKGKIALEKAVSLDEKGKDINVGVAKKLIREASQKIK